MAKKKVTKDVAKTEHTSKELTAGYQNLFDMKTNLEGLEPRLPQIKILHGEAQMFLNPDGTKVDSFEAIILDFNRCNAYWEEAFETSGGGSPPDCASMDSISVDMMASNIQTTNGKCSGCKQNVFGTGKGGTGEGKACKNMMRVHLLFDGQLIPFRMTVPATSLATMDEYIPLVASKGIPFPCMRTKFSLVQKKQKKGGALYSRLVAEMIEPVSLAEAQAIKAFVDDWKGMMRSQAIDSEETDGEY